MATKVETATNTVQKVENLNFDKKIKKYDSIVFAIELVSSVALLALLLYSESSAVVASYSIGFLSVTFLTGIYLTRGNIYSKEIYNQYLKLSKVLKNYNDSLKESREIALITEDSLKTKERTIQLLEGRCRIYVQQIETLTEENERLQAEMARFGGSLVAGA